MTEAQRQEHIKAFRICEKKAKKILKPGDRVGCSKCPGGKRVFTFQAWDGHWMVSITGINDYSPANIYSINGVPVNFKSEKYIEDGMMHIGQKIQPNRQGLALYPELEGYRGEIVNIEADGKHVQVVWANGEKGFCNSNIIEPETSNGK